MIARYGNGLGSCGAVNEARDHGVELVAPVVSPGEAGEVALGMIGAELAVGSGDRALDVAERRVDPFEGRHAGGLPPGAGADRAMASDDPVERVPAAQAVGEDLASGGQPALGAARDLALAEALDRDQLDLARPALGGWWRPPPRRASCPARHGPACRRRARRRGKHRPSPPAPTAACLPRAAPSPP